jgi:hypothetical protein
MTDVPMDTPASLAKHLIAAIESEAIPEAWAEFNEDPLQNPLVVFFVSVSYRDPGRPFGASPSPTHTDEADVFDAVMAWLREGIPPATVARKMRRRQKWAWGAIALDLPSLAEELESRYALSHAKPETNLGWARIPGGIVVTCEVILRGRES